MKWLDKIRDHRRSVLGLNHLTGNMTLLLSITQEQEAQREKDHEALVNSLAEVRALLGLTPDEAPATKEEIYGTDIHGL